MGENHKLWGKISGVKSGGKTFGVKGREIWGQKFASYGRESRGKIMGVNVGSKLGGKTFGMKILVENPGEKMGEHHKL